MIGWPVGQLHINEEFDDDEDKGFDDNKEFGDDEEFNDEEWEDEWQMPSWLMV